MARLNRPRNQQERKRRLSIILRRLNRDYPDVECALIHNSAWELLAATILSAQCTDKRVNQVTAGLFRKYPTIQDMAAVRPEVLESDIQSTGFFRNKAKSLTGAAKKIMEQHGGEVPQTMDELLTLPGVARKTANVVLGTWFGISRLDRRPASASVNAGTPYRDSIFARAHFRHGLLAGAGCFSGTCGSRQFEQSAFRRSFQRALPLTACTWRQGWCVPNDRP